MIRMKVIAMNKFIILCRRLFLIATMFVLPFAQAEIASAKDKVTIGTGGPKGVYVHVGKIICQDTKRYRSKIKCKSKSTTGSAANLRGLRNGKFDIVVAYSYWARHALNGTSIFSADGADVQLRSIFAFHPEPLQILARKDANIRSVKDLKGKRINIGTAGSFAHREFNQLIKAQGWSRSSFSTFGNLKPSEQGKALCSNKFDAVVYSVGYPSGYIEDTAKKCEVVLVELTGPRIDKLVRSQKDLRHATIPKDLYKGISTNTKTFGMGAVVLTRADVPEDTIYILVKAVIANLKKTNSAPWFDLKPSEMIKESLTAKLHPGAARFYREKGWLK